MIVILSVALISILISMSMGNGVNPTYAVVNKTSTDFATVETLGKSYSFGLDYTTLFKKNQILKTKFQKKIS